MKLKEKVALITGAARGIGKGIAEEYAKEGARLILTDIMPIPNETVSEIGSITLGNIISQKMDVRKPEDIEKVISLALKKYGKIDILVNNAGICRTNLVIDAPESELDLVIDTNLKGAVLCSKAIVKEMIKLNTKGKIITIASIMSRIGEANFSYYTASKHAVLGFMRCLAYEVAHYGINVNSICPGFVDTDMERSLELALAEAQNKTLEDVKNFYKSQVPLGRFAQPRDIARAAVFLASSDSDYITGQAINVCGGVVMS
jgi:NAD(P)-dependent dehydrogenase (short-subunit alcohol dehydrogenase family)